jgi:hypoxanthine-DNA glycosylase
LNGNVNYGKFVTHTLRPVYDKNSKILILGTIPSVKYQRYYGFYYAPLKIGFWRVISEVLNINNCLLQIRKEDVLIKNKIALWDVLKCCYII